MAIRQTLELKAGGDREKLLYNLNKAIDKIEGTYNTLQIIVADDFPLASLSQRGYLFGVVLKIIEDETGQESSELYEIFKTEFGDPTHVEQTELGQFILTTKTYTTKNMTIFIEKIRAWAQENGLYIPEPNEVPNEVYLKYNL